VTTAAEDFDFSDVEDKAEVRESNVLPRTSRGSSSPPRSTGRRGSRSAKRLNDLKSKLSTQMFQSGSMIALGLPVTGTYVCQQAEVFPDAIIDLASTRADWIDALEKVANVGPGITVGRTILGIGAAMGADRWHRTNGESGFSPDKRACQFLGVTAAYYAVHKEDEDAVPDFTPPPHGAFVPVS
jgi:hypothetical protein